MKKIIHGCSLLAMLCLCSVAWSSEISGDSLDKLMDLSGLDKQVVELPGMVMAGVQSASEEGAPISGAALTVMQEKVDAAFNPVVVREGIGSEIKNRISESDARELIVWYESELGRRVTREEEQASTPAAYQEMIGQAQPLLGDQQRVAIAQRINKLVNGTEMAMELQTNTGVAVFSAVSKALNPGEAIDIDGFRAMMAEQEPQIRQSIEQLLTLSFVYTYRNIDVAELEQYLAFLERPITMKFNDAGMTGMKTALNQSIQTMAESLAVEFANGG